VSSAEADLVPHLLQEYGDATRVALCEYLQPREPVRHLYGPLADYPRRGGRMLRASLCLATARAFGAKLDQALGSAVAVELMHNAFLVHDDIEDESELRRGRPTLHELHGVPLAVNVGDALNLAALRALIDNRSRLGGALALRILEDAQRTAREAVEGQAIELGWRRDNAMHVSEADYLQMILKKTCWYTTIFPCRAGALIGSAGRVDPERFLRFGFFVGAAFQIQDDLLNLVGDRERYGKELLGDLLEGKRTLMLIHLLRHASFPDRMHVASILERPRRDRTEDDAQWILARMTEHGSIEHARNIAHGLAGAARHEFSLLFDAVPDSRDKRFVSGVVSWVLERR
jgi:geranylgeranyl diphosphate synthase, type II